MILYAINCKFRDVVLLGTANTSNAHTSLSTSPYLCDTAEMHSKLAARHSSKTLAFTCHKRKFLYGVSKRNICRHIKMLLRMMLCQQCFLHLHITRKLEVLWVSEFPFNILSVKIDFAFLCSNKIKIAIPLKRFNFFRICDLLFVRGITLHTLQQFCTNSQECALSLL